MNVDGSGFFRHWNADEESGNGFVSVQSSNAQEERNCRAKVLGIGVA